MKKTTIVHEDLTSLISNQFRVNLNLEVFYTENNHTKESQIGCIEIIPGGHEEKSDELALFLPGWVGFSHYPCYTAEDACQKLLTKFNDSKEPEIKIRRK